MDMLRKWTDVLPQKTNAVPSSRQIGCNIVFLWGHKVAYLISSLIITGVDARFYGLEEMGVWILGTTLATYIALLDFGAASALPRILPRLLSSGRHSEASRLVSSAFFLGAAVSLIGMLAIIFGGVDTAQLLLGEGAGVGHYDILAVVVLAALGGLPLKVGYGLLATSNRFDIYSAVDLAGVIFRLALVLLVVLEWRLGIFFFALVAVLTTLLTNMIQFYLGVRQVGLPITFSGLSRASVYDLISHTGASLLLTFSAMMLIQGSTLAAATLGLASVSAFAIPLMLVTQSMSFSGSLGALVTPVVSSLSASKEQVLGDVAVRTILLSASISVPIVVALFFAGPAFVYWWLGAGEEEYASMQQLVLNLHFLSIGVFFLGPASAVRGVLLGVGRHWGSALSELSSAVLGLGIGLALLHLTALGVSALAIGVSVGFMARLLIAAILLKMEISLRPFDLATSIFKPSGLLLLSIGAPMVIFGLPDAQSALHTLMAQVIMGGTIWAIGAWWLVLTPSMRNLLTSKIRKTYNREA
jgi:O-antigen/teichoic acid export membrane protein